MSHKLLVSLSLLMGVLLLPAAKGLSCYQCASTDLDNPFQCNEFMPDDATLQPESCDHIDNARYCLKFVGRTQGQAIRCYQCDSTYNLDCSDMLIHEGLLQPQDCGHIAGAAHCVKAFGRFAGTLGTIRSCSTSDMGNQCMDVQQVGDQLRYRSCIYTCDTDGCNAAANLGFSKSLLAVSAFFTFFYLFYRDRL